MLKALSAGAALSVGSGVVSATDDEHTDNRGKDDGNEDDRDDDDQVDQPEGFKTEVVAPHTTFPDEVGAALGVDYEDGLEDSAFLHDASTVLIVRGTIEPGGTSGWHVDRGPVIGVIVEGEVTVTFENDCVPRTYAAGEAFVATGRHADLIENESDTERVVAYVIFLGVPDGEPPSRPVEPPDC